MENFFLPTALEVGEAFWEALAGPSPSTASSLPRGELCREPPAQLSMRLVHRVPCV